MKQQFSAVAAILLLSLGTATPIAAQQAQALQSLQQRIETIFHQAGPGTRFGLVVATEDGTELIAIRPDERFLPASNVKLFTTAAAFDMLPGVDQPDIAGGASVRLDEAGDAILAGHGDARMSSAPDCVANCLATLADAVAAKTRAVRDVVGDDSLFPDQRWSPGMSWEDIPTRSGTAISALTLDDNVLALRVTPAAPGRPPVLDALPYFIIDNRAVTGGVTRLIADRLPGSMVLRVTGTIATGAKPVLLRLGIDDPAHYAAWRFKTALEARGVRVTGKVATRHRAAMPADDPAVRGSAPLCSLN